jgi:two-component system NtrC family sensor kinase
MDPQRARLIQSEKMSAAGNLLAGIVHELNNPLTTILGFSELLLREGNLADPGRLEKIHAEAERSVRIIQNVLRLARADDGEGVSQVIDINDAIRRTIELAQYQIKLNRIEFELSLSEKAPRVLAYSGEITQVILNLVTNAIQAISSVKMAGRIHISSALIRDRVRIAVSDDGPGIRPSDLHRIFEPFFTTKKTGHGLGLNLSRRIIRENGGEMSVANNPSCGATFTIELPVTHSTGELDDAPPDDVRRLAPDRSVLIVDDEDHITELIESVLQDCGYRTDRLNDGAPAIEMMKGNKYDILICDLHMPGVSGRDLIEWTRMNRQHMHVLLLSGDVARKDVNEFAKSYGVHFLSKPFSVSELTKAVQRLFS